VKDALGHVGSYARVTLSNGKVHTGEIIAVQENKITLQKSDAKNAKGAMTYGLALDNIAKLDVVN
jgi:ribosome maturation factor RimP